MATLNAIGGSVDLDMRFNTLVNHAAQAAPVNASQYSWTTTTGILIHAFSFADDITFNGVAPLGGTVHALQAVNSYTVGGLVGDLVSMASGNESYWRPILSAETTVFASSDADFYGAGDFVLITTGETLTGAADLFEGAEPPGATTQSFFGDAVQVQAGAVVTGANDIINMRADGTIAGDADLVIGELTGGDDTIVINGAAIDHFSTGVSGDVIRVSDLEQPIAPTVVGGDDKIIVKNYAGGRGISGDIMTASNAALGTTFGGDDFIDGSANAYLILAAGDVGGLDNHTVRGGNDTLIASATIGSSLYGDASAMTGGTLFAGADTLIGGEGADFLVGDVGGRVGGVVLIDATFTGDDRIYGAGGADNIYGQEGDDTLDGGMGDDFLDGGLQTAGTGDIVAFNTLAVAVSVDLVLGFAFGQGVDTLRYFESIRGSNLSDSLGGDNLANRIEGLDGNDQMFGRQGKDTLIGGTGKDVVKGGADNDTITGGANADTLTGGGGNDRFDYNAIGDSGTSASTRDLIEAFVQGGAGGDLFDLHDIDAQATVAGNQDFTFIGAAAFSAEGQIRFSNSAGHTFIEVNTSGVSGAEMVIDVVGTFTMTGADLVL